MVTAAKTFKTMRLSVSESKVAEVVFTEAERGNPIDQTFCDELNALSCELADRSDQAEVRAVLVRAEGKAFSFGGDLSPAARSSPTPPTTTTGSSPPTCTARRRCRGRRRDAPRLVQVAVAAAGAVGEDVHHTGVVSGAPRLSVMGHRPSS